MMNKEYSAHLVYGVVISGAQALELKKKNSKLYYTWVITPEYLYSNTDTLAVGYYCEAADEGAIEFIGSLREPSEKEQKELAEVLDYLGITTKPGWLLMCQVS